MNNFLLEIYSEEIPSSAQKLGEKELVQNFNLLFDKEGISYSSLKTFSTPRRITIVIEKVFKSSLNCESSRTSTVWKLSMISSNILTTFAEKPH